MILSMAELSILRVEITLTFFSVHANSFLSLHMQWLLYIVSLHVCSMCLCVQTV